MPKSILIDATHLGRDLPTGVEIYASELLPPLSGLLLEAGWRVAWVGHGDAPPSIPPSVEWVRSPHSPLWGQVGLARLLRRRRPHLFYTPSGIPPLVWNGPTSLTVHDLGLYADPASYSASQRMRLGPLMRAAARRASVILVPSQFTKSQLEEFWKVPPARITVASEAYEVPSLPEEPLDGVGEKFILYMGRIERKKGLSVLAGGFARMEDPETQLVLAGKDGYGASELKAEVAVLPEAIRSRITFPGYVSEGQKKWLYARASVVAVPCRFEGFGLPVLEAFAHKVPCLCAHAGALPFVADEAACYVRGERAQDWAAQLQRVLTDKELRLQLTAAGSQRLKGFTWRKVAETAAQALISNA